MIYFYVTHVLRHSVGACGLCNEAASTSGITRFVRAMTTSEGPGGGKLTARTSKTTAALPRVLYRTKEHGDHMTEYVCRTYIYIYT